MQRFIDKLLLTGNYISSVAAIAYIYSMLIHPFLSGGWKNTHAVWLEWQSLNVGVLAFAASVIAFNISRYHSNQQRNRELIAARSFLPQALSDLTSYLKECATLLGQSYTFAGGQAWPEGQNPEIKKPALPEGYAQVFEKCISLSDAPLADYLSHILMKLQINQARLTDLANNLITPGRTIILRANAMTYLFRLGELQCMVNALFPYSRGEEELYPKPLDSEAFRNAYANLNVLVDVYDDLEGFTNRAIERNKGSWKIA